MFVAATNQAANFTAYQEMKKYARRLQNVEELPSYQHLILGGISGAMGNNNKEMGSTGAKNSKFRFFFQVHSRMLLSIPSRPVYKSPVLPVVDGNVSRL